MRPIPFARLVVACACFSLVALLGCGGPSTVTVSGNVVLPPNIKFQEKDTATIAFMAQDKDGKNANADVSPADGSFTTKDVLPGKYKITVNMNAYPGTPEYEKRNELLQAAVKEVNLVESTKLSYEVTKDAQQSITIDLAKSTVAKK